MSWDETVSPRLRRIITWAYGLTFLSGGLLFVAFEIGGKLPLLVIVVFLPAFFVSWATTLYLFYDMTLGSYLRFRRMKARRQPRK